MKATTIGCKGYMPGVTKLKSSAPSSHSHCVLQKVEFNIDGHCIVHLYVCRNHSGFVQTFAFGNSRHRTNHNTWTALRQPDFETRWCDLRKRSYGFGYVLLRRTPRSNNGIVKGADEQKLEGLFGIWYNQRDHSYIRHLISPNCYVQVGLSEDRELG